MTTSNQSNDQQWVKLFKYLDEFRNDVNQRFKQVDARFDHVYSVLDSILKRQSDDEQERAATYSQLSRHENWIYRLADKTGTDLTD